MKWYASFFIVLLNIVISCGGESSGVVNDPGSGTGTLKVEAIISGRERFSGAKSSGEFTTDITVKIWDAHLQTVQDAYVTITTSGRDMVIPHDKNGVYKATSIVGYDRVYTINIQRGDDYIDGVTITGPEIHTIKIGNPGNTPTTVKASGVVTVLWTPYGYAIDAEIETKNFNKVVSDSGSYDIPEGNFEPGVEDFIRITREKYLNPAGAIAGSIVTVKIRNALDPVTVEK